ncbi:MAG TPA: hypothetical protein VEX13_12240, partial [Chloroflexia bacterium]|nr:hypothetical protein [Chloroflexia bacterium]
GNRASSAGAHRSHRGVNHIMESGDRPQDEEAIRGIVRSEEDTWNVGDGRWSGEFKPDHCLSGRSMVN